MKENIKLGLILLIITSIAGFSLGLANNVTEAAIAANSKIYKEDLNAILPSADSIKDSSKKPVGDVKEVLDAYKGSQLVGHVIKVTAKGFHGDIDIFVAINKDGRETGIKIMSQVETPGVGSKIGEAGFQNSFKDKDTNAPLTLVKVPTTKSNEVEGVSGATISSKAVLSGVNEAIEFYKTNIKG